MSEPSRETRGECVDRRHRAMARMLRRGRAMRVVACVSAIALAAFFVACGGVNMSDDQRSPARAAAGSEDDDDDVGKDAGTRDGASASEEEDEEPAAPTVVPADAGTSGDAGTPAPIPPGSFAAGTELETTADLNLRDGPGTDFNVLVVIPIATIVKVQTVSGADGWVNVDYQGTVGYASKTYLEVP